MSSAYLTYVLVFLGSVVAAAVSATVGFGGALLLLPVLSRTVGPEVGVPLLTIAQLVGNLSRAVFGFRVIVWRPALIFVSLAVPASIAGSYCFVSLPKSLVTRAIGIVIIVCVVSKWRGGLDFEMTERRLAVAGAVVGFLSGLVGSAGPLGAAAFLGLELPPASYISTEATVAVAMHASKMAVYGHFIAFDATARKLAAVLSLGMILGSWIGKKTLERLAIEKFRFIVGAVLGIVAFEMVLVG